jgi:hypothetical protein
MMGQTMNQDTKNHIISGRSIHKMASEIIRTVSSCTKLDRPLAAAQLAVLYNISLDKAMSIIKEMDVCGDTLDSI